jgi:signal transduction histidine kinase
MHTALAEMRTLLLELRPESLTNTPLGELLAQLTEAVTGRSSVDFELFIEKIPLLPEEAQTNFYRIAQEALNNVVKHAQARLVTVSLNTTPLPAGPEGARCQEIRLAIRDDGVGFDFGTKSLEHLGLSIMRERAAAIGADLSLASQPGYGTSVELTWIYEISEAS